MFFNDDLRQDIEVILENLKEELSAAQNKIDRCAKLSMTPLQLCRNEFFILSSQSQHFLTSWTLEMALVIPASRNHYFSAYTFGPLKQSWFY